MQGGTVGMADRRCRSDGTLCPLTSQAWEVLNLSGGESVRAVSKMVCFSKSAKSCPRCRMRLCAFACLPSHQPPHPHPPARRPALFEYCAAGYYALIRCYFSLSSVQSGELFEWNAYMATVVKLCAP